MALLDTVNAIEEQRWLEPASDVVQRAANEALTGGNVRQKLDNVLNGTWLGHPLHPVLTDVPIGAWTVASALDVVEAITGSTDFVPGADAAVTIGIVGALGSAVTGIAQWQYTIGRSRRVGLAHALLNVAALGLYSASAVLRGRGARRSGMWTAVVGYGIMAASAYLGGDLVYAERLGVDHTPEQAPPDTWTPAIADAELTEGALKRVEVDGVPLLLVRQQGRIYALDEVCSHLGGPLSEGTLDGCSVICPWHGSQFALDDGHVINGPATFPQPHYKTRLRDGRVEICRIALPSPDGE
jgi:nitrite reductase/ring-hydroxylating ferredoxin subunit/uncharacterized membrane protein